VHDELERPLALSPGEGGGRMHRKAAGQPGGLDLALAVEELDLVALRL